MHDEDTCCVDGCDRPVFVKVSTKYPDASWRCRPCYMRIATREACRAQAAALTAARKAALVGRPCRWCGEVFQPRRANHRCCSDSCATSWSINRRPRLDLVEPERRCEWCGCSYQPPNTRTRHCSSDCGHAARHRLRRMRKKINGRVEDFPRRAVFERDEWTCRLCGDPIDPDVKYPDRLSASIDHVVPIALGGEHVFHNVQATHLACNVSKRAELRGQIHMAL